MNPSTNTLLTKQQNSFFNAEKKKNPIVKNLKNTKKLINFK